MIVKIFIIKRNILKFFENKRQFYKVRLTELWLKQSGVEEKIYKCVSIYSSNNYAEGWVISSFDQLKPYKFHIR